MGIESGKSRKEQEEQAWKDHTGRTKKQPTEKRDAPVKGKPQQRGVRRPG